MNVQDYRKKFSKYIEKELRSRIEDLATVWQPAKLGDLYQVLCDWMDIQTDPIGMVQQKIPSLPMCKCTPHPIRLGNGEKAKIVTKILDTFQDLAGTQKSKFSFRASEFGLSRDEFVRKIGRSLNRNPEKLKRFPDLRIKCQKTNDGAMFYLSRKDEASGKNPPARSMEEMASIFGNRP